MNTIDTHVHVWDLSQYSYSWTAAVPLLNRTFLMEEYDQATRELDVSQVVLVEADVDEAHIAAETRHLLALAVGNPRVRGVVAGGRPEAEGFEAYLDEVAGHSRLKGIRRVLHTQPDGLGESAAFAQNIRKLEKYGLSFDICVLDRQLPVAIGLVEECPGVSFILDHCGGPPAQEKGFDLWRARIERIARFPNLACKISGLVGYSGHDDWSVEDVRLRVDWAVACFGWDRLMFGSDWPVCTLSTCPKEWAAVVRALTRDASESNRRKLFSENAERLYRL